MKIGFFIDLFYPYMLGGIEQRGYELAKQLALRGDEVTVFSTSLVGTEPVEYLFDDKLKIVRTGFIKNPLEYRRRLAFIGFAYSSHKFMNSLS